MNKMELKILEDAKNKLVFQLKGEDHTFCNILVKELQKDDSVKSAAYRIDHPLERIPTLLVEADDPRKAIKKAIASLKKQAQDFLSKVEKEL